MGRFSVLGQAAGIVLENNPQKRGVCFNQSTFLELFLVWVERNTGVSCYTKNSVENFIICVQDEFPGFISSELKDRNENSVCK